MPLYVCRKWEGFVQPLDGQTLKWVWPKDLRSYPMPPATRRSFRTSSTCWPEGGSLAPPFSKKEWPEVGAPRGGREDIPLDSRPSGLRADDLVPQAIA